MNDFKIGIDLSTRNIGVCIIDKEDSNIIYTKTVILKKFKNENFKYNSKLLMSLVPRDFWTRSPLIYIELSKYSMKTSQMFSFYAGILYGLLEDFGFVKFIDPNKWQDEFCKSSNVKKIIKGSNAKKGEVGFHKNETYYIFRNRAYKSIKDVLREVYLIHHGTASIETSQDEIDAYFIALFGEKTEGEFNGK